MSENEYRYFQNKKSGEIHRAIYSDGNRFTRESCNVDDIKEKADIDEAEALEALAANPEKACGHCLQGAE